MREIVSPLRGLTSPFALLGLAPALALDLLAGPLDPRITFTRASSATRVNSSGVLELVGSNVPAFDWDPVTGQPRGLGVWEQRTNRTLQSEDFSVGAVWQATVSGTSTRVNDGSPLGFMRGLITATSATGGIRQTHAGLASGQVYALSFYIQSTSTSVQLVFENGTAGFGAPHNVTINPSNGTAGVLTGFTSVRVEPFGPGFIYTLITAPAGGLLIANIEWRITNSGESIRLGRPQFEAGAFAPSYIPTAGTAATRSGDVPTMTGTNFSGWFNPSQGTFVVEANHYNTLDSRVVYAASDGTPNNEHMAFAGSGNLLASQTINGGVSQASLVGSAITPFVNYRTAYAYAANDFAACVNGGAVLTDTAGTLPTVDRLSIGIRGNNSLPANGYLRRLWYYPTRLPNALLQALTA